MGAQFVFVYCILLLFFIRYPDTCLSLLGLYLAWVLNNIWNSIRR